MMANKPLRPCSSPGCTNLTTGKYCPLHQDRQAQEEAERHKYYDTYQRDEHARRFYQSVAWKRVRMQALVRDNGLCQECLKNKRITLADTVHHIEELRKAPDKALKLDNLVSICASCHNKVHTKG